MTKDNSVAFHILLVEDEPNFGSVLRDYLELNDFTVDWAKDGEEGLQCFQKGSYDLCILDVMMPKRDGFSLGREIRSLDAQVPFIYLTAKSLKEDIREGFRIGADDYINKPVDAEVLLMKIRALLRRTNTGPQETVPASAASGLPDKVTIGKYTFEPEMRILSHGEEERSLSPRETQLLKLLCLYQNRVMPRSEALTSIWGADNYFTTRSMDVFITRLRKYLRDDPRVEIINQHGNGYVLKVTE